MNGATGKVLLCVGLGLACLGLILLLAERPGFWRGLLERVPLGRLPGDVRFQREGFSFFFPWVTCLVVSLVATLLLALFRK